MSNRAKIKSAPGRRAAELERFVNETQAALLSCTLKKFLAPSSLVRRTVSKLWDVAEFIENDVFAQSIRLELLALIRGELTQVVLPQLLDKVRCHTQEILIGNGDSFGGELDINTVHESAIDSILHDIKEGFFKVLVFNSEEMLHRVTINVAKQKYGKVAFRMGLRTWRNVI